MRGELFQKGLLSCENNYFILRQQMPYPLQNSNSYIIESSDGWVVIDVGVNLPSTKELWEKALKEIGISFSHINRIYITHCHPDHLGAANWLQQKTEAYVYIMHEELKRANKYIFLDGDFKKYYKEAIKPHAIKHDFDDLLLNRLVKDWFKEVIGLFPKPEEIVTIFDGDTIELHGNSFTAIKTPIHCDGQFVLWCSNLRHLFCADVLAQKAYLHFTDWPNTDLDNPLQSLFSFIEAWKDMNDVKVFPGHGDTFVNISVRLEELKRRHIYYLDKVYEALKDKITAGQLYSNINKIQFDYVHLHRVLLGETLGYLVYLQSINKIASIEKEAKLYFYR